MNALQINHEVGRVHGLVSDKTKLIKVLTELKDYELNLVLNALKLLTFKMSKDV